MMIYDINCLMLHFSVAQSNELKFGWQINCQEKSVNVYLKETHLVWTCFFFFGETISRDILLSMRER